MPRPLDKKISVVLNWTGIEKPSERAQHVSWRRRNHGRKTEQQGRANAPLDRSTSACRKTQARTEQESSRADQAGAKTKTMTQTRGPRWTRNQRLRKMKSRGAETMKYTSPPRGPSQSERQLGNGFTPRRKSDGAICTLMRKTKNQKQQLRETDRPNRGKKPRPCTEQTVARSWS
jgi:hypothetical protein